MWFETELCPECVLASGTAAEAAVKDVLELERIITKQKVSFWDHSWDLLRKG